ncbi:MAG: cytochrome C oxidase subunit IV family protein [Chitinophagales bacterium]|nr:cytochrome C oxidase subunit IV family protein [Chitinophagales bacterium]
MSSHLDDATYHKQVAAIWRATIIIAVVTVFEVGLALSHYFFFYHHPKAIINVFMVLATLLKAFYIIAEFMHLKYEHRSFIIILTLPLIFLVWLIIALSVEGTFWFRLIH